MSDYVDELHEEADTAMDEYNNALRELADNMGWAMWVASAFWEGGSPDVHLGCWSDLKNRGYLGDSDDPVGFGQFLYDNGILSIKSLEAMDFQPVHQWEFFFVWGEGYIDTTPYNASTATRTRDQVLADESLEEFWPAIMKLQLGESIQGNDHGPMTIVRIK